LISIGDRLMLRVVRLETAWILTRIELAIAVIACAFVGVLYLFLPLFVGGAMFEPPVIEPFWIQLLGAIGVFGGTGLMIRIWRRSPEDGPSNWRFMR
jgi:hypothetical protein